MMQEQKKIIMNKIVINIETNFVMKEFKVCIQFIFKYTAANRA